MAEEISKNAGSSREEAMIVSLLGSIHSRTGRRCWYIYVDVFVVIPLSLRSSMHSVRFIVTRIGYSPISAGSVC